MIQPKLQIMKTKSLFTRASIMALLCIFISNYANSQIISTDIRLNTQDYFDVSMDGSDYIAVDDGNVYVIWQGAHSESESYIYFNKSTNGGETFSAETAIYTGPTEAIHVIGSIDVANNIIYIAWTAITDGENEWNIWFTKSTDGGTSFATPTIITTNNSSILPNIKAYNDNVYILYADAASYPLVNYYFVKSANNGDTWDAAVQINDQPCLSSVYFSNLNAMEIDPDGNLYLAWTDGRNEDSNGDIYLCKSTNSGATFTTNVMVNDIADIDSDSVQYFPSIGFGASNKVLVSFDDLRLGSDESFLNSRIYVAQSDDGGNSFASEEMLPEIPSTCKNVSFATNSEEHICLAALFGGAEGFGLYLFESNDNGETYSNSYPISDEYDSGPGDLHAEMNIWGSVFMVWIDEREGPEDRNVYFSYYSYGGMDIKETTNIQNSIFPNPATNLITISNSEAYSQISIYTLRGQLILNEKASQELDVSKIPAGTYIIKMLGKDKTTSERFIKL